MIEYRVKWKREGLRVKRVKYTNRERAERRAALLTSAEPWLLLGKAASDLYCCSGYECGCCGVTVQQESDNMRARMPALQYVLIEQRQVGKWGLVTDAEVVTHALNTSEVVTDALNTSEVVTDDGAIAAFLAENGGRDG